MTSGYAFVSQAGETRNSGVLDILGDEIRIKVAGSDTNGGYAIMEAITEPECGPPLHRHSREDESFFVIEGEFLFEVDGKQLRAGAGCAIHAPRGTAHTFQNVGETTGRMMVVVQPAGLDAFFEDLAGATKGMGQPDPSVIVPIFEKHGLELLGPPLGARPKVAMAAM